MWAAELQPEYASELNLIAVAAGGLVMNVTSSFTAVNGRPMAGLAIAALIGFCREHDDIKLENYLNDKGKNLIKSIQNKCAIEIGVRHFNTILNQYTNVDAEKIIHEISLKKNQETLGQRLPKAPIFLYQALFDDISPITDVRKLVQIYCNGDVNVNLKIVPISEHFLTSYYGIPNVMTFFSNNFQGKIPKSSCPII